MMLSGKPVLQHVLERFLEWSAELRIALIVGADHSADLMLDKSGECSVPAINDPRVYTLSLIHI